MAFKQIKIRRGSSPDWGDVNPVLAEGEPGIETDTLRVKFGDDKTPWNELSYIEAYSPDALEIAKNSMKASMYEFYNFDNDNVARDTFRKMCDIFFPLLTRGVSLDMVRMDIFDADYIKLGTFGPNLTEKTIMKTIQRYDNQCPITVRFYIPFVVGQRPHLVYYNDLYGSIIGHKWFKKNRKMAFPRNNDLTEPAKTFIKEFYKQIFNTTISNNMLDTAKKTFTKVRNDRAVRKYKPKSGSCSFSFKVNGKVLFDELCPDDRPTTRTYVTEFVDEYTGDMSCVGVLFYKELYTNGRFQGRYIDKHSSRFPKMYYNWGYWQRFHEKNNDNYYTSRGPVAIYVYSGYNENENKTTFAFRIGGSCANKIVYQSDSIATELGMTENSCRGRLYTEICFPRTKPRVKLGNTDIDFSKAFRDQRRPRPFSIRVEVQELVDRCPNAYNTDSSYFKCRFGFYNKETKKFSQPTEWIKVALNTKGCGINAYPLKY